VSRLVLREKRANKRLLRLFGARNDGVECGGKCGERGILNTKTLKSLPLRQFFAFHN